MAWKKGTATQEQKDKWAEERDGKITAAKEALEKGLLALQTGDEWKNLLTTIATSARKALSPRRYSFTNQMLVAIAAEVRKFDGSAVGTFAAWERVGRRVKKGEKAIYIMQPQPWKKEDTLPTGEKQEKRGIFFRALAVFALGQTEGEELPEVPSRCGEVQDDVAFAHLVDELAGVAKAVEGAYVSRVEVRPRAAGEHPEALGWYRRDTKAIVVIDDGNRTKMFSTLVHEVAHATLHSLCSDHHQYARNEVEAESVAYIVSAAMGFDVGTYSFPYVATWAERTDKKEATRIVQESGERIMKAVNAILDALEGDAEEAGATRVAAQEAAVA